MSDAHLRELENTEQRAEIARLRALNAELVEALISARHELEQYEKAATGETYNNTKLNVIIAKAKT